MRLRKIRGTLILLLTALIWGVAFVAQSVGMDYVGPFTFSCVRSVIGGIVLLPVIALISKLNLGHADEMDDISEAERQKRKRLLLIGGISCGIVLGIATCLQQIGIIYTTVGKAGFITAFYIIIVPIMGLFFKKKCGPFIWIGVALALMGLYCLCINESLKIEMGDLLIFICAFLFSIQIMLIDYFGGKVNGIKLSCIQFFTAGALSGIGMLLFEHPHIAQLLAAWQPILYAGVLSSGVAYTLQIIGQRDLNPTVASLIMSLESVISVLAGMLILGEIMSTREIIGCILMFAAIVLAQLPQKQQADQKQQISTNTQ